MARAPKASDRGQLPRNQPDDKTVRCTAVEGAQQCLSATHHHLQNHRWGKRGETDQWNADGTPKIPDPAGATDEFLTDELRSDLARADEELKAGRTHALEDVVAELDSDPHAPRDPATASEDGAEWFEDEANAAAERERARVERNRAEARERGEIRPPVATDDERTAAKAEMERRGASHPDVLADGQPPARRRVDPTATREEVMRAAMSTYTHASQESFALVHSLEATRLMELAGLIGEMFATNGNGELVDVDHIREAKRLVRLLADTRGVDPLAGEAGS